MSSSSYWGDQADDAARSLHNEQLQAAYKDQNDLENEGPRVSGLEKKGLFSKLEFKWKREDKLILDRIRVASETVTSEEYKVLQRSLDELYEQVRVPKLNQNDVPVLDSKGRYVWERDESGRLLEDWSRLDGMDLEITILHLQTSRVELATRTNELLQEAIFAKHIYNDEYYEGYQSLIEGTQGDRSAQANRSTREEKYFAFYKYCVWQSSDVLLKEIVGLQRILERIRDWRIRSQR